MDYNVLIIGSDANAYYLARCYHEQYHEKAYVLAKSPLPYTKYSNIVDISYNKCLWQEDEFLKAIYDFKRNHGDKLTLLISSNETYAKFISKNSRKLSLDGFIFNYPKIDILESFIMKEKFYKTYVNYGIDLPKTYYFDCLNEKVFKKEIDYPVILKPSNVIMYNHLSFEGKNKIYKVNNLEELNLIITKILKSGYRDYLIIQDFIPGDDSYLFDAVAYVSKDHKVKLLSLAQIGLQDHRSNMVGNATVLINGYNQFGKTEMVEKQLKTFLEKIDYQGFAEFDLKYDYRDNKFKVLEVNARQGRSSYYITPLGYNLVKLLVDDLIYNKDLKYKFLDDKVLLSFVPLGVIKKNIKNVKYVEEVLKLWNNNRINPISYNKDNNFKRKLYLVKKHFGYYREYKNGYWKVS